MGLSTEDVRFLSQIDSTLSGMRSDLTGSWNVVELFSATVATNTTTTGAVVSAQRSSSLTVMVDVTGQLLSGTAAATGATGLILTLRGGQSGFMFVTTRAFTAGLGQFAWKVAVAGVTTGATAETTGITRFENIFLQANNPATATGGSVVIRARAFLSPEF